MIPEPRSQERMQLPSWSLGTLAFEEPATICKKSDHPEISRSLREALEDEMPHGRREREIAPHSHSGTLAPYTCGTAVF